MTELTGLTVWGETVKKVKTVNTKNHMTKLCESDGLRMDGKRILMIFYVSKKRTGIYSFKLSVIVSLHYTRSGCEMVISAPGEEA